jgi:hypothetical protein
MLRRALLSICLATAVGCANTQVSRIFHPGSAEYQQTQAQQFDPYILPDIGPDVANQNRPQNFLRPAPEAERIQNEQTFEERFGQASPPGTYRPPRGTTLRQTIPFVPGPPPQGLPPNVGP